MLNNRKSGKSLILLAIVICVMSVAMVFVGRIFNNNLVDNTQEEAFKVNVYDYCLQLEDYKEEKIKSNEYIEEEFNYYGVEMKSIIPDMIETDMSKFKIENGKLIYIGVNEDEEKWTKEVKI